ncbi:putative NADPH-dependent beta-ketoacyl reductase [Tilletiopsis washingtonensis]|uniref:Putative NADPH-dependent beta-ketoacyl reductase n=1 Tax=Tilletiopsis washingtonensis TaxID=58919 RepID=A0A316ZE15_9BASI|nr:putative NADPH-dependent beta-ketoacyl reductase [Tilletiopsis washingtonensis]PWN99274.1 putative NADPH-dependent beta-ketoacyl reductase [Tilletiopsis washingtonensis]
MPKDVAPDVMPELASSHLFSVRGKVALVTGGASGLGKMMAATLVRNGAKVYIASRKMDELEKQAKLMAPLSPSGAVSGPACIPIQANVDSKAGCDALAAAVAEKEKRLDILINNSGLTWGAQMTDFPEQKGWDKVFALNVKSQFYLTVALLPLLEVGKSNIEHASVINIASVAAIMPMAEGGLSEEGSGTWSYQPSKAASVHLSRTMANSLAERHVLVNAICPGVFPSRMTSFGLTENKEILEAIQPTGRVGTPEDIGGLVLMLTSRAGSHMTGLAIPIDGGQSLQYQARL